MDGENSGEVFVAPFAGYMGSTFKILQFSKYVDEQYIVKFIEHYRSVLKESKTGSAIPHLNKNLFKQLQIGIPPVTEQKRIVETIKKYFAYLDNIVQSLA